MPAAVPPVLTARRRRTVTAGLLTAGVALFAVVTVVLLILAAGDEPYLMLGYSDPGAVTKIGVALLRFMFELAASVCAGSLVYATFFTAGSGSPLTGLSAGGWAALRLGGAAAWVWFGTAVVLIPFDAADSIGLPVSRMVSPARLADAFGVLYEPVWWTASAVAALAVAIGCRVVLRWRPTLALAGLAIAGLLPPVIAGHTAAGPGHDIAMTMILFHMVAAALWLGVLVALLAALHLRRTGRRTVEVGVALRRYPRFAAGCWVVLAVSGVTSALYLVPPAQLATTGYGLVLLAKMAGLLLVGVVGAVARSRVLGPLQPVGPTTEGDGRTTAGLVAVEIAVLVVSTALTMSLVQTPPPAWFGRELPPLEVALGYPLASSPGLTELAVVWRFDLLLGGAALLAGALYLAGVRRLRQRRERWPIARTLSWLGGCFLVLAGSSAGLGAYAPAVLSAHMSSHMTLNMAAPLLLVLGAPVTLALRALPAAKPGAAAGPREWVESLLDSPAAQILARPAIVAVLFVGSYYLLYFTPLFEATISEHWSRMALNVVVLVIGYQFFWVTVGADPAPRRLPHLGRLGVVFATMPFHALFGVILISLSTVIADNYYRTLGVPWAVDLLADQRVAGVVSLVVGELVLVVAQVVLLVQWYRYDELAGFRPGQRAFDDLEDADAAAYREMLTTLRRSREQPRGD